MQSITTIAGDSVRAANEAVEKIHELSDLMSEKDTRLACVVRNLSWALLDLVAALADERKDGENDEYQALRPFSAD